MVAYNDSFSSALCKEVGDFGSMLRYTYCSFSWEKLYKNMSLKFEWVVKDKLRTSLTLKHHHKFICGQVCLKLDSFVVSLL